MPSFNKDINFIPVEASNPMHTKDAMKEVNKQNEIKKSQAHKLLEHEAKELSEHIFRGHKPNIIEENKNKLHQALSENILKDSSNVQAVTEMNNFQRRHLAAQAIGHIVDRTTTTNDHQTRTDNLKNNKEFSLNIDVFMEHAKTQMGISPNSSPRSSPTTVTKGFGR